MTTSASRLLKLLSLLQTHRGWTGAELAQRLDVSHRTIRKDIERLRDLGYPIDATRGATGGYRLGAGATMPPLLLDDDEAVATVVGLMNTSERGISGLEEASLRTLAKLQQVLPARLRRRVESLRLFSSQIPSEHTSPQIDPDVLQALAIACQDHEKQRLAYQRYDGQQSRRIVEPHRVVNWGHLWYLVAWDDDRKDWRTFRVDRIAKTEPTGLRFQERDLPEQDITAYVARNVSRAGWRYQAHFIVQASAADVISRINPAIGTVTPVDATSCVFEAGADELWTIAVFIGILGYDFTVDGPPELIAYLKEIANRYNKATEYTT